MDLNYNHIFMIVMLFMGILLFYNSWNIDSTLQDKDCKSVQLKTANKVVLCIGLTLIVSSISFFTCTSLSGSKPQEFNFIYYVIALSILGILLIVLGSVMIAGSEEINCQNYGNPSMVLVLGIIIALACGGYFYYAYRR